jgi:ATP-dependent Clp endopeptidase proteolytic subunit ClpP
MSFSKRASTYMNTTPEEEEDQVLINIHTLNNKIYFYDDINKYSALKLRIELETLVHKTRYISSTNNIDPVPIYLYINSEGGEVAHALSIVDFILNSSVPIYTVIEGEACSAATLISIVGAKRLMTENSHMLIHQVRGGLWGKMNEFEDEMKNLKTFNDKLIKLYKKYTNMTENKLDKILKKDITWSSKTCLRLGLVDEIIE